MRKSAQYKIEKFEVLHEIENLNGQSLISYQFLKFNEKQFKILYDLRNGVQDLSVYIMDSDGRYNFVLDKYCIGHKFVSYVYSDGDRIKNYKAAIELTKEVISKIYG